jgi:citrate lyase subunit beta/citryl-CoA lyase
MKMNPHQRRNMNKFVRRSSLIFPVNVQRFVEKAYLREADCIIMDLEDSIPNNEKDHARTLIKESIPVVGKGGGDVAVRINSSLKMAEKDLESSIWHGLSCISLPKVESSEDVRLRDTIISNLERKRGLENGSIQIAVAVETAFGVINAYDIASSSPRIVTIGIGAEDLTQEMGVQTTMKGDELWYARSKILMDANAAGIQAMGLVGVEPFSWREPEKNLEAAIKSRKLGFKGAQSIHPAPIPYLNKGFSIPEDEVTYMKKAFEAFEDGLKKGIASINFQGRMIDIATAERCKKVLERARAIEKFENHKRESLKNPNALEEKLKNLLNT